MPAASSNEPDRGGLPGPAKAAPAEWTRRELWCLLAIVVLAAAFRLWQLEALPLAASEARTWQLCSGSYNHAQGLAVPADAWQPLVPASLRLLADSGLVALHEPGSLRLPFAFLGILTVPLLSLLGCRLLPRRTALLAAACLAVHPLHVTASQTAAPPVVGAFFVLLLSGVLLVLPWPLRPLGSLAIGIGFLLGIAADANVWLLLAAASALLVDSAAQRRTSLLGGLGLLFGCLVPGLFHGERSATAFDESGLLGALRPMWLLAALVGCWLPASPLRWRRAVQTLALLPPALVLVQQLLGLPGNLESLVLAAPPLCLLAAVAMVAVAQRCRAALGGTKSAALLASLSLAGMLFVDAVIELGLRATVFAGSRAPVQQAAAAVLARAGRERLRVHAGTSLPLLAYYLRPDYWRDRAGSSASLQLLGLPAPGDRWPLVQPRTVELAVLSPAELAARPELLQRDAAAEPPMRVLEVLAVPSPGAPGVLYVLERSPSAGR